MVTFEKPKRSPDFEDSFSGKNAFPEKTPKELAKTALANSPMWFRVLFSIRQKLANLFGLRTKTDTGENPGVEFLLSLPVLKNNQNEYEAGLSDKHLDFTILVSKEDNIVSLTTQIWFNNFWGKAYLFVVMPFHNLIVSHWVKTLGIAK